MTYILIAFFAFFQVALGNFDLYQVDGWKAVGPPPGIPFKGYMVFDNNPECKDVDLLTGWRPEDDLSNNKLGVRCVGKCGIHDAPWPDVELVEMHFTNTPNWHFTIYKDKGHMVDNTWRWWLFGTDGKTYGECFAYGDHVWSCDWPIYKTHLMGYRKFRCLTDVGATAIDQAFKNENNWNAPSTPEVLQVG